jgi:hypothetical protein
MTTLCGSARHHVTTVFPTEYVHAREVPFSRVIGVESSGDVVTGQVAP